MGAFDRLANEQTVVVTTYKKDGSPVATPVNAVVLGEHAYFRTWSTSGKAKRLRRDPRLQIAPSTMRGRPTGPAIEANARLVGIDEEETVKRALSKKHRIIHGWLVPLAHRVRHYDTIYYELSVAA